MILQRELEFAKADFVDSYNQTTCTQQALLNGKLGFGMILHISKPVRSSLSI